MKLVKQGGGAPSKKIVPSHEVENLYISPSFPKDKVLRLLGQRIQHGATLNDASFDNFPYHLDSNVKEQLTLCTGLHLIGPPKLWANYDSFPGFFHFEMDSKEGGTLHFQETLARGLAHHYNAAFISLDRWDMALMSNENNGKADSPTATVSSPTPLPTPSPTPTLSVSPTETEISTPPQGKGRKRPHMIKLLNSLIESPPTTSAVMGQTEQEELEGSIGKGPLELVFQAANKTLGSENQSKPLVLYIRGLGDFMANHYSTIQTQISKARASGRPTIVIGSIPHDIPSRNIDAQSAYSTSSSTPTTTDSFENEEEEGEEDDVAKFHSFIKGVKGKEEATEGPPRSTAISILPPKDPMVLATWIQQMKDASCVMTTRDNHRQLAHAIYSANLGHEPLGGIKGLDKVLLLEADARKIIECAASSAVNRLALVPTEDRSQFVLQPQDVQKGVDVFMITCTQRAAANESDINYNPFESKLLPNLLTPGKLQVKFDNIGALDKTKETLKELISLPLQRPHLFSSGLLSRSISGILLFGPPGTGKTMLGKAVAAESGSNFLHVSMSDIMDMYVGQGEKNAKAVFTLARKHAPCVIFLDEVDSLFAQRSQHGYATKREVLNEFMAEWDGLKTDGSRVLVLAATNRPMDLDDAVLRRMPYRLLVDLPDQAARQRILEVILKDEKLASDVSMSHLAAITTQYSGSDLNNFCMAAALRAVKDTIQQETVSGQTTKKKPTLHTRHFQAALQAVKSSAGQDPDSISKLHEWNGRYGVGGKKPSKVFMGFSTNDTAKAAATSA